MISIHRILKSTKATKISMNGLIKNTNSTLKNNDSTEKATNDISIL